MLYAFLSCLIILYCFLMFKSLKRVDWESWIGCVCVCDDVLDIILLKTTLTRLFVVLVVVVLVTINVNIFRSLILVP